MSQDTNSVTYNPLLGAFELDDLSRLDELSISDEFIKQKRQAILRLIKDIGIDFNSKLKNAYDEYCEAIVYLILKNKFEKVTKIRENLNGSPDFKVEFAIDVNRISQKFEVFAELKAMSFADGNLNYRNVMDQGLQSRISSEEQQKEGKRITFGIIEINPWHKSNKNYDPYSRKYPIEVLIEKIEHNLKEAQFLLGETIIIIDTKQLSLPDYYEEGGVPTFIGGTVKSLISGVPWNVTFGKIGHLVYKPIVYEGEKNIEGELDREGILHNRDWIKAICFIYYTNLKQVKILGLHRYKESSKAIIFFLHQLCDFVNDDLNTNGWNLTSREIPK